MAIRIDGTNTTANPGITGADTDTGLQFGTNELKLVTGGTEAVTVESNGNLTIEDGNLVVASGHGIDFSADANASGMTSELLDDYEEGTYTPSFSNGSWTYTGRNGSYIKTGNKVTVWIRIIWSARPLGANLKVNLPFTSAAASAEYAGTVSDNGGYNYTTGEYHMGCAVNNNSNQLFVYIIKDVGVRVIANSTDLQQNTFTASVTYQTA